MPQNLKRSLITGLLMGISGWILMIGLILMNCRNSFSRCMASGDETLFPAFISAAISGMVVFWFFGQAGRRGWFLATVGAVLATTLGLLIGVALMGVWQEGMKVFDNPDTLILGPYFMLVAFDEEPGLILIWATSMVASHLILRQIFQKYTKE